MRSEFDRRSRFFVNGLYKIKGFRCRMPKGAFYVFPNIEQTGWMAKRLADALLSAAVGVQDRFGDSRAPWELVKELGVSAEHIAMKAADLMIHKMEPVGTTRANGA
jgi:hypothetical protein